MSKPFSQSLLARRTVVVATSNKNKVRELTALLEGVPVDFVLPSSVSNKRIEVVEDGDTFEANAEKKARAYAAALALPAIADDSGLEVDALGGEPGVRSARYAGEGVTDADNVRKLLEELTAHEHDGHAGRAARFRCVLTMVDPVKPDMLLIARGSCEGKIASAPRGGGGFGYDPVFIVRDAPGERTMAELSEGEKNEISHRAVAARAIRRAILAWLGVARGEE